MRRREEIGVTNLTAREQARRLVDLLPEDALDTGERVLAGLSEPTTAHQKWSPLSSARVGRNEPDVNDLRHPWRRHDARALSAC